MGAAIDHIRAGNRLLKKGDINGARGEFESALIDEPESPVAVYNLGTAELLQGNLEPAQKRLEQAAAMSPEADFKSRCAYNMGHLKFLQGDRSAAIEKFKEALRLNPKDLDAKYNIEYLLAGKTPPPQPNKQPSPNPSSSGGEKKSEQGESDKSEQQKQSEKEAKENAERVLQMIQEQEKESRKKAKPVSIGDKKKEKDKKDENAEDW
jgi:tetratricopeptide (TPR) repeat protein